MEVFRATGGVDKFCALGTSERSCVRGAARRGPGSRMQDAGCGLRVAGNSSWDSWSSWSNRRYEWP